MDRERDDVPITDDLIPPSIRMSTASWEPSSGVFSQRRCACHDWDCDGSEPTRQSQHRQVNRRRAFKLNAPKRYIARSRGTVPSGNITAISGRLDRRRKGLNGRRVWFSKLTFPAGTPMTDDVMSCTRSWRRPWTPSPPRDAGLCRRAADEPGRGFQMANRDTRLAELLKPGCGKAASSLLDVWSRHLLERIEFEAFRL